MKTPFTRFLLGALCALGSVGMLSAADDTTEVFSKTEAAKLLGKAVARTSTMGPEKDDDAPAEATHWIYFGGQDVVTVTRLKFASAAAAAKFATPMFIKKEIDEEEGEVTAEPGVGDKGFWTVSPGGGAISFLKGSLIMNVALAGPDVGAPENHKAALKAAAVALAAKL